jgi:TIR domain-containing protein/type VII secretion system (Wss) protein YukD
MSELKITLETFSGLEMDAVIPDDIGTEDLVSDIVEHLNLPRIFNERPITYSLLLVKDNSPLPIGQTLQSTGIMNGDVIRLISSEGPNDNSSIKVIAPINHMSYEPTQCLHIFICYSSNDKKAVHDLYNELRQCGFDAWLDENRLLPGQDWNLEIRKAVRNSNIVLVCLSRGSIGKAGFIQKEIKYALDVADEQPEGSIFLVPLKLEECDVPERLRQWQWVNFYEEQGLEKLLKALNTRARQLGLNSVIPVTVHIIGTNIRRNYDIPSQALVREVKEQILRDFNFPKLDRYDELIQYVILSRALGHTLREDLTFSQNGVAPRDLLNIARVEISG